eukprot:15456991-Alexandrium_andersonii.AAC.1
MRWSYSAQSLQILLPASAHSAKSGHTDGRSGSRPAKWISALPALSAAQWQCTSKQFDAIE